MKEKIAEIYELLFGFRKFIIAMIVIVISIIFRSKSLLNGGEFVDLVKAVSLSFFGTNTVEGIVSVVKDHIAARKANGDILSTPKEDEEVTLALPGDK